MSRCVSLSQQIGFKKTDLSLKLLGHTMNGICNWWFVDLQLANRNGDAASQTVCAKTWMFHNYIYICFTNHVKVLPGSIYLNLNIQPCWRLLGPPEVVQLSCQVWRAKHLEVRRSLIVRTLAPNPLPFQDQHQQNITSLTAVTSVGSRPSYVSDGLYAPF